ncbi:unnamed protein product [Vicia faba]|uniref:Uncharacterized protein n=1 Tax=Vicia faba TaxID=3906 RepID=A0AAV1A4Z3_VICFA|nr:unnamed protein product [Vicia faba]
MEDYIGDASTAFSVFSWIIASSVEFQLKLNVCLSEVVLVFVTCGSFQALVVDGSSLGVPFADFSGNPVVARPIENGGLGIRNLKKFNTTMLRKWEWKVVNERRGIWFEALANRNNKVFQNEEIQLKNLVEESKILAWRWLRLKANSIADDIVAWCKNPKACLGILEV